jgi:hypothetical protein
VVSESKVVALVNVAGVPATSATLACARDYLMRIRRARIFGIVLGLVAGFGPLAGEDGQSLVVPRMFAGYLIGLLLSELFRQGPARQRMRAAALQPRSSADLVPRVGRVLPWLTLVPLLATPVLAVGWHPRGVTRFSDANGDCTGAASWPRMATLLVVAGLAAAALVATMLILRRLARRALPAEDETLLTLECALRLRSARSATAAATALGLILVSGIAESIYTGMHSYVCRSPLTNDFSSFGNVYSWAPSVAPWLQKVSLVLFLSAFPVWWFCQRLPVPGQGRRPVGT